MRRGTISRAEKSGPDEDCPGVGVSQPSAQSDPFGSCWRSLKAWSAARGSTSLLPCHTSSTACANRITSSAVENRPAWPATPPLHPAVADPHPVARGGEQARVARDAAHRPRVRVVPLAPDDPLPPRAVLGGG